MICFHVSDDVIVDREKYTEEEWKAVKKTVDLFGRIKRTEQAEMIATVLYSYDELQKSKKDRKKYPKPYSHPQSINSVPSGIAFNKNLLKNNKNILTFVSKPDILPYKDNPIRLTWHDHLPLASYYKNGGRIK